MHNNNNKRYTNLYSIIYVKQSKSSLYKVYLFHPILTKFYHTIPQHKNRHEEDKIEKETETSNHGYFNISDETMEILENIRQAISQEKHSTNVITGLLTTLVIILTTFVLYLCFSRGISSMSKYVM